MSATRGIRYTLAGSPKGIPAGKLSIVVLPPSIIIDSGYPVDGFLSNTIDSGYPIDGFQSAIIEGGEPSDGFTI
jgi:hypothetical protein